MKKYLLLLFLSPLFFGCDEDECMYSDSVITASSSEVSDLQAYLDANSITATQHPSGFFYTIVTEGSGATPGLCSAVTVQYIGRLTNGTIFDASPAGSTFYLGRLIVGWQKGIPLIKAGGTINLYLPPSMGYGSSAVGSIPANSILIFEIQLTGVQ
jgi:FKBP-type peptidyl-prolyl cis-trans isomerase FkpA